MRTAEAELGMNGKTGLFEERKKRGRERRRVRKRNT